jgi:hypothetical protein
MPEKCWCSTESPENETELFCVAAKVLRALVHPEIMHSDAYYNQNWAEAITRAYTAVDQKLLSYDP